LLIEASNDEKRQIRKEVAMLFREKRSDELSPESLSIIAQSQALLDRLLTGVKGRGLIVPYFGFGHVGLLNAIGHWI